MGTTVRKIIAILSFTLLAVSISAQASPEYDRVYQLETLSWLRANDNVDGIFSDYLEDQYAKYFKQQSRFVIKPLNRIQEILGKSSIPYGELIQKAEVLKKIAVKYQVECLLRTKISKEADTYRFVLEIVFAPKGDVLSTFEFRYIDPGKDKGLEGSDLADAVKHGLDELIKNLPFLGQVTGVQNDVVTVNIGRNQNIKPQDILSIYTLQNLKRHPILNTIEEWRWQPVGRVQVDQVEDSIAFGKVIETEPNANVIQFNKVREVSKPPAAKPETAHAPGMHEVEAPRLGWVAANIGGGFYSREVGLATGTSGRTGSGFMPTFEAETQIWLNSRWLSQLSLGGMLASYAPNDLSTGASEGTSYNVTGTQFRIAVGYAFFPAKTIFDPTGWVALGYKSTSYTLPPSNDYTSSNSFGSLLLSLGGEVPIQRILSAQLGIDIGLIRSASQVDTSFGTASSSTDLGFNVAGVYHFNTTLHFRLLLKLSAQSIDFSGGQSVTEKTFSVSPSIMYYF